MPKNSMFRWGGNTDTPITAEDRKRGNWIKDRLKDIEIWLNENK